MDFKNVKQEWNLMNRNLKVYMDDRIKNIKEKFKHDSLTYKTSFLRGPINGPIEGENTQFLIVDVFITKDKKKIFVFNKYHLDTNKYNININIDVSDGGFSEIKDIVMKYQPLVKLEQIRQTCISYNKIAKDIEDYVKDNLAGHNISNHYPKLRGDEYGWHIDTLCEWDARNDFTHIIIPLDDRYVPYMEKTFIPVEYELFKNLTDIQCGLLDIFY